MAPIDRTPIQPDLPTRVLPLASTITLFTAILGAVILGLAGCTALAETVVAAGAAGAIGVPAAAGKKRNRRR